MSTPSIACTLRPDALRDRVASLDALAHDALLGREEIPGGLRTRLRHTPEVERRVHELAEAEARCCPFLTLSVGREGDVLLLEVTGPAEARPVIERLLAPPAAPPSRGPAS